MQSFPNLPIELRIKIWEYALPGGRNIEIYPVPTGRKEIEWKAVYCRCPTRCHRLPSIAHVNSEARAIFFQHFTTCFNTYIQWKNDTILVQSKLPVAQHDTGSKEIRALDEIILASPRSSELSSFAITINLSRARNRLPHFLKPFKMSKPHGSPNLVDKIPELLVVVDPQLLYGRQTSFNGLRFDPLNSGIIDYDLQLSMLEAANVLRLWLARLEEEGEGTMPPYRMVTFERNALSCFKDM